MILMLNVSLKLITVLEVHVCEVCSLLSFPGGEGVKLELSG